MGASHLASAARKLSSLCGSFFQSCLWSWSTIQDRKLAKNRTTADRTTATASEVNTTTLRGTGSQRAGWYRAGPPGDNAERGGVWSGRRSGSVSDRKACRVLGRSAERTIMPSAAGARGALRKSSSHPSKTDGSRKGDLVTGAQVVYVLREPNGAWDGFPQCPEFGVTLVKERNSAISDKTSGERRKFVT